VATNHSKGQSRHFLTGDFELETEVSPGSQAPLIKTGGFPRLAQPRLEFNYDRCFAARRVLFAASAFWGKALTRAYDRRRKRSLSSLKGVASAKAANDPVS